MDIYPTSTFQMNKTEAFAQVSQEDRAIIKRIVDDCGRFSGAIKTLFILGENPDSANLNELAQNPEYQEVISDYKTFLEKYGMDIYKTLITYYNPNDYLDVSDS